MLERNGRFGCFFGISLPCEMLDRTVLYFNLPVLYLHICVEVWVHTLVSRATKVHTLVSLD